MKRIRLVHWNADEAAERVEHLRFAGYEVDFEVLQGGVGLLAHPVAENTGPFLRGFYGNFR